MSDRIYPRLVLRRRSRFIIRLIFSIFSEGRRSLAVIVKTLLLAAAYARLGDKATALRELRKAVQLNPALASEARKDEDLESLRSDRDFLPLPNNDISRKSFNL
jgi:hypothetical protein